VFEEKGLYAVLWWNLFSILVSKLYPQWQKVTNKALDEFKKDFPLKQKGEYQRVRDLIRRAHHWKREVSAGAAGHWTVVLSRPRRVSRVLQETLVLDCPGMRQRHVLDWLGSTPKASMSKQWRSFFRK
jgi:hypothetical protein